MEYVFIVTYGKSGSTLLLDALNTTPGWCLRGENGGALYSLYEHYRELTRWQDHWSDIAPLPPSSPWFGIDEYPRWDAKDMLAGLAEATVMRPTPTTRVTGFKEIRWDYEDLHDYLDWIEATFPGARFIGNVRPPEDTAKSGWWKQAPNAVEELARLEEKVRTAISTRDHRGFVVDYAEYGKEPEALRGLFAWLGEDFDKKRVRYAYGRQHGTDMSSGSSRKR